MTDDDDDERQFREAIARERRDEPVCLPQACAAGDAAAFFEAVDFLNERAPDGWRLGMMRVARLPAVNDDICAAFLTIWIESKMLPLKVGNRRVLADALRLLMPCDYHGPPIRLYRGAIWQERRKHRYGFSWARDRAIARGFAERFAGIGWKTVWNSDPALGVISVQ